MTLLEILQCERSPVSLIKSRSARIHGGLLKASRIMDGPNFRTIGSTDLKCLFEQYDEEFFRGHLRLALGNSPIYFRLSRRLTSAAGQMTRRARPDFQQTNRRAHAKKDRYEYEIAVSTTILFQSFSDASTTTTASGLHCNNRLEALQRVFEHELIHLAEMLVWSESRCAGQRFQSIANRLFGHREHTHRLVTSREHALTKFGFQVGDLVAFRFEGKRQVGRINRITRRATILVEDQKGLRYTDGKHYRKFYIPLGMLERPEPATKSFPAIK